MCSAAATASRPASVSFIPSVCRVTSWAPSSASRAAMRRPMVEWSTLSARAAALTEPCR